MQVQEIANGNNNLVKLLTAHKARLKSPIRLGLALASNIDLNPKSLTQLTPSNPSTGLTPLTPANLSNALTHLTRSNPAKQIRLRIRTYGQIGSHTYRPMIQIHFGCFQVKDSNLMYILVPSILPHL